MTKTTTKTKNTKEMKQSLDLKAKIRKNSLFFDRLVELIPAKYYLPPEEKETVMHPGLKKREKAALKKESRENTKKSRRARLDPDRSLSTLELLKKRVEGEEEALGADDQVENDAGFENPVNKSRSVTYEELRARYVRKVQELAQGRAPKPENKEKAARIRDVERGKRKREETEERIVEAENRDLHAGKTGGEVPESLEFGSVKIGNEDGWKKKKRKHSKAETLEKAQKLEEAKKDSEKGEVITKKHSWKAAANRAMGIKVHDDPKLIKQSLKKEKKRQQKSAVKWKERLENVEKRKEEKQQKRKEHISDRIHQKKMRKIAKREKKLMRPGFEGRKEGFINDS